MAEQNTGPETIDVPLDHIANPAIHEFLHRRSHGAKLAVADYLGVTGPEGFVNVMKHPLVTEAESDLTLWQITHRINRPVLVECWRHYAEQMRRLTPGVVTAVDGRPSELKTNASAEDLETVLAETDRFVLALHELIYGKTAGA